MDAARWERIQDVFNEVVDLPEPRRGEALRAACDGDDTLVRDVLALLGEDDGGATILTRGLGHVAQRILGNDGDTIPVPKLAAYRIKGVLGEGGSGVVYLAERRDLGSLVALKILRDAWLSPARRARFESEQRTLAQLNHPGIARLYDAGTLVDGTPWFAMEYVKGSWLTRYCREHDCCVEERLLLFRAVCEAVQYAHEQAIIHRDIKPSNILVTDDGAVKLLDFGTAKQLGSLAGEVEQTRTVLRFMTPAYAAPEQLRGDPVGTRSDIYSLGVVLYELLTGAVPFDVSTHKQEVAEIFVSGQEAEPPSVRAKRTPHPTGARGSRATPGKAASRDLDVMCLTAMRHDAERRYRSAEALIRDIDHYFREEPLEARADSTRYKLGKFVSRNRRILVAASLITAALAGQAVFYGVRVTKARNAAEIEADRTERIQQFMLNLFGAGDSMAGPGQELKVVTIVDRGAQEARALDKEPAVQAKLYLTLATMYDSLGKYDRAESLIESARKLRETTTDRNSVETAETLLALSRLRGEESRLSDSEQLAREALAIESRRLSVGSPTRAQAESRLGEALLDEGEFDKARPLLEDCVRVQSAPGGISAELSQCLKQLAALSALTNHYGPAKSMDEQAMDIDRKIYGPAHPHIAQEWSDLADFDNALGNYAEAEKYIRRAIEIDQSWYGAANPETATQMTRLAQTLGYEGRFDEEKPLLEQTLTVFERSYGKMHPKIAIVLNELMGIDERDGNMERAQSEATRMVGIFRSAYGENNYQTTTAEANLGHLYLERKEYARAEKVYRAAIPLFSQELAPEHPNVGIVQIDLGRVLLRERRYKEAKEHTAEGYRILAKQASPSMKFMKIAYEDLADEYDGLHEPEKAKRYRAQLAAARQ